MPIETADRDNNREEYRVLRQRSRAAILLAVVAIAISGFVLYQHSVLVRAIQTRVDTGTISAREVRIGVRDSGEGLTMTGTSIKMSDGRIDRVYIGAEPRLDLRATGTLASLSSLGRAMLYLIDDDCTNIVSIQTSGDMGPILQLHNKQLGRGADFMLYDSDAIIRRINSDGTTDKIGPNNAQEASARKLADPQR